MIKYGICVGTPQESVLEAGKQIRLIMQLKSSDDVKVAGLRVLGQIITAPTQATITDCTVWGVQPKKKSKKISRKKP